VVQFSGSTILSNGIPSDDTLGRVLARLDPGAFEKCLLSWIQAVQEVTANRLIAIDGKTLRGSFAGRDGKAAIHMVSARATENKLSLGQVVVAEKSNEITAIPELLQLLDVTGALVTIDAMGCQKEIAAKIRERGGDYVWAVKQNQPTLHEQVTCAITAALEADEVKYDEHSTVESGHGRRERRSDAILAAPETVDPEDLWQDLHAVGVTFSERVDARGRESLEARYYILSTLLSAEEFAGAVRGRWGIEIPQPEDSQSDNLCAVGRAGYHRLRRPVGVGRVERQQLSGPRRYLMRNSESACVPPRPRFLRRTH
jgi:predicted transposase YbfD/YdcC